MTIEIRLEEIRRRMRALEQYTTPSAENIAEYLDLKKEEQTYLVEQDFQYWLDNNKETIEKIFSILFNKMAVQGEKSVIFEIDGEEIIVDKENNQRLNEEKIKYYLNRHGYTIVHKTRANGVLAELEIKISK